MFFKQKIAKYCKNCKKYEAYNEKNSRSPYNCVIYIGKECRKQNKLFKFLSIYFPLINKKTDLYSDYNELKILSKEQVIKDDEPFGFWSVRIRVHAIESIDKYKEIWVSKIEGEAQKVVDFLNEQPYYWFPLESLGKVYKEWVEL